MRILVTGADGQLGRSVAKIAGEYPGHSFLFADRARLDINDAAALRRYITESGAEGVLNCAAYTAVDRAETERAEAWRVNRDGAGVISGFCAELGLRLVHISTDYVFDGRGGGTIAEDSPTSPLNVYGESKLAGEAEVIRSGAVSAIVRSQWIYSEFERNFALTMLRAAAENKKLRVVNDQFGAPTYAAHLARAIIRVLEEGCREGCEIYHYSDAGETSWYGFASEIFGRAGIGADITPVSSAEYSAAAVRPKHAVLGCEKITAIPGVQRPGWREGVGEFLNALKII